MEKKSYGNTFNNINNYERFDMRTYVPWVRTDEFYPCGVFVKPGDNAGVAGNGTFKVGDLIPAGTGVILPEYVGKTPKFDTNSLQNTKPGGVGFTYEDAYVGTEGCSLTVVTRGVLNITQLFKKQHVNAFAEKAPGISLVQFDESGEV